MRFALTLSLYIGRQFTTAALSMLAGLSLLIMLFDFIELLRRAAAREDVGFGLVVSVALLRLPYYVLLILPFAMLLGGMVAFWRLARSSELVVARAAGVSAWQFLAAPLASFVTDLHTRSFVFRTARRSSLRTNIRISSAVCVRRHSRAL